MREEEERWRNRLAEASRRTSLGLVLALVEVLVHISEPEDLGASLRPVVAVDRPEGAEVFVVGAGFGRVELRAPVPREPARELDQLAHLAGRQRGTR